MSLVIIRAFIIYVFVIIAIRIMGKRQVGELKPHELVITFLISSTATIPLQDNNMPLLNCIIPVLLFVSLEIIVAILSIKSVKFRNLIQGKPIVIIDKGKIDEKKLRQLRFTVDDLCDALRQQGYWDIAEVQNAVIETNGSISAENWEKYKPLTPDNVKISVDDKGLHTAIVIDGKPVEEYFKNKNIKQSEIELLLKTNGKQANKLLLMTVDDNGNVYTVRKAKIGDKKLFFAACDGLIDSLQLSQMVVSPILKSEDISIDNIKNSITNCVELNEAKTFADCYYYIMSGFAIVVVDGENIALAFGIQNPPSRSVDEPTNEQSTKAPKEAFVEILNIRNKVLKPI